MKLQQIKTFIFTTIILIMQIIHIYVRVINPTEQCIQTHLIASVLLIKQFQKKSLQLFTNGVVRRLSVAPKNQMKMTLIYN